MPGPRGAADTVSASRPRRLAGGGPRLSEVLCVAPTTERPRLPTASDADSEPAGTQQWRRPPVERGSCCGCRQPPLPALAAHSDCFCSCPHPLHAHHQLPERTFFAATAVDKDLACGVRRRRNRRITFELSGPRRQSAWAARRSIHSERFAAQVLCRWGSALERGVRRRLPCACRSAADSATTPRPQVPRTLCR